jgi:hypothetical protein
MRLSLGTDLGGGVVVARLGLGSLASLDLDKLDLARLDLARLGLTRLVLAKLAGMPVAVGPVPSPWAFLAWVRTPFLLQKGRRHIRHGTRPIEAIVVTVYDSLG